MQLIEHEGGCLDCQIITEIPILQTYLTTSLSRFDHPLNPNHQTQHSLEINQGCITDQHSKISPKTKKIIKNTKTIHYDNFEESSEFLIIQIKPNSRRKRTKPQGYPTKNFLQNFKTPHFNFLEKNLGIDFVNGFK